jgi:hypothetical protein
MKSLLVTICLLIAGFSVAANKKPLPLGVYMVLPSKDPNLSNEPCWKDPNIVGVTLRMTWSDIEGHGAGYFNWSYFDQGLAQCQNNPYGTKYAVLSVNCGRQAPNWVTGQPFTLHTARKGTFTVVAPWDSNFQAQLAQFITAFGQRYDGNPYCLGISIWAGGYTWECWFAGSQQDTNTLNAPPYNGPAIWLNAAENVAAEFAQAFPTTQCYLSTGTPILDADVTMTTLTTYCQSLGMGIQTNTLTATNPDLTYKTAHFMYTNLTIQPPPTQVPLCRFQLLAPLGDPRMGTSTLATVLNNAYNAKANNVEIYPSDLTYGGNNDSVIAAFNKEVGAP